MVSCGKGRADRKQEVLVVIMISGGSGTYEEV